MKQHNEQTMQPNKRRNKQACTEIDDANKQTNKPKHIMQTDIQANTQTKKHAGYNKQANAKLKQPMQTNT